MFKMLSHPHYWINFACGQIHSSVTSRYLRKLILFPERRAAEKISQSHSQSVCSVVSVGFVMLAGIKQQYIGSARANRAEESRRRRWIVRIAEPPSAEMTMLRPLSFIRGASGPGRKTSRAARQYRFCPTRLPRATPTPPHSASDLECSPLAPTEYLRQKLRLNDLTP